MLEYLVFLGIGITIGIFTGLIPGIHPNTVVFTTLPVYFGFDIDFMVYMSLVAGLSVSHTFHDFLPAIFLGAPEAETALSSPPGTEMAIDGRGLEAFDYTVVGGALSIIALTLAMPFLLLFLESVYGVLEDVMEYLLAFFLFFIVFRSNVRFSAVVAMLSGLLGVISFTMQVNQQFVLVPIFSGLFAMPAVIHALRSGFDIPDQREVALEPGESFRGGIAGFLAGLVAGIFPGLGAAVSTSFLAPIMSSRREFLAGMGGVNTSDIITSFLALYMIGKSRSGASVALASISEIGAYTVMFLAGLSLVAVAVSSLIAFKTSRLFVRALGVVDFAKIFYVVALVLAASTLYLTGVPGLLVFFTATCIGYAALLSGERAPCMAVLLVPAIAFYTGLM